MHQRAESPRLPAASFFHRNPNRTGKADQADARRVGKAQLLGAWQCREPGQQGWGLLDVRGLSGLDENWARVTGLGATAGAGWRDLWLFVGIFHGRADGFFGNFLSCKMEPKAWEQAPGAVKTWRPCTVGLRVCVRVCVHACVQFLVSDLSLSFADAFPVSRRYHNSYDHTKIHSHVRTVVMNRVNCHITV